MQKHFSAAIPTVGLVLALAPVALAQGPAPISAEAARRIDAIFAPYDNTRSPGCALGVSEKGTQVYSRGYGMSNLEYDVAIGPDSIFHVASISKQFTALSIALLAKEGKLRLDDDVRQYLPELPDYGHRVTIRHLLTHTSGIRDQWILLSLAGWRQGDLITEGDVLDIVTRQKSLNFQPGAESVYSNTGFTLLAVIVKRVSGRSLREFAEAQIFGPLGMHDTHFHDDHTMIVRRRTSAYQPRPGGGWRIRIPVFDTYGATSLFTTVGDLLKWEDNFDNPRIGSRALLEEMQTPARLNDGKPTERGLGLVLGAYRGARTVGHGGADAGYRADVLRFPDQHVAVAVLCNLSTVTPSVLTRKVAEVILSPGVLGPIAPEVPASANELEALAGVYWNRITDEVRRVVLTAGRLTMQGSSVALVPLGAGRFRIGEQATEITFSKATGGAPQELRVSEDATGAFTRVAAPSYLPSELQLYAGEYRSDELEVSYQVSLSSDGRLMLHRRKFDPVPLETIKLDVFYVPTIGTISFARASTGVASALTVSNPRLRRLVFTRVGLVPRDGSAN